MRVGDPPVGGRYSLVEPFGADERFAGGKVQTWRAQDSLVDRAVVLRVMTPGGNSAKLFLDRALEMSLIAHPGLGMVYDAVDLGEHALVVCEWIDGTSLADTLKAHGPLTPTTARKTLGDVAEAITVAHHAGLPIGGITAERVVLRDNGSVTVTGVPALFADERGDIQQLGKLLYAALTGEEPTVDDPDLAKKLHRGVPRDLAVLCQRALDNDPARQLGSAAAFAAVLRPRTKPRSPTGATAGRAGGRLGGLDTDPVLVPPADTVLARLPRASQATPTAAAAPVAAAAAAAAPADAAPVAAPVAAEPDASDEPAAAESAAPPTPAGEGPQATAAARPATAMDGRATSGANTQAQPQSAVDAPPQEIPTAQPTPPTQVIRGARRAKSDPEPATKAPPPKEVSPTNRRAKSQPPAAAAGQPTVDTQPTQAQVPAPAGPAQAGPTQGIPTGRPTSQPTRAAVGTAQPSLFIPPTRTPPPAPTVPPAHAGPPGQVPQRSIPTRPSTWGTRPDAFAPGPPATAGSAPTADPFAPGPRRTAGSPPTADVVAASPAAPAAPTPAADGIRSAAASAPPATQAIPIAGARSSSRRSASVADQVRNESAVDAPSQPVREVGSDSPIRTTEDYDPWLDDTGRWGTYGDLDDDPDDDFDEASPTRRKVLLYAVPVLALILVVLIAVFIGEQFSKVVIDGPAVVPSSEATQPEAAPTESGAPAEPPAAGPLPVVSAAVYNPFGDGGSEHDDEVGLAADGDPATAWETLTYESSPEFGNLKPGVGVIVDLGAEYTLNSVELWTNLPGSAIEIRVGAAPDAPLENYPIVGTLDPFTETATVALAEPVQARFVIVWFVRLVESNGGFQGALAECRVIGS